MKFRDVYNNFIIFDYYRYLIKPKRPTLVDLILRIIIDRGFHYCFWLRLCYLDNKIISIIARINHYILSTCYGIQIPIKTKIGKGFRLNHGVGIVINESAEIGDFVTMHQFTTIGTWKDKAAKIGNNVLIGPNVCIVDDIIIGNNVIIGAGSVVVKDVEDNSIIAGNPAKTIKKQL